MKIRNVILGILAASLLTGAVVGANETVQTWKGKAVRVTVNGNDLDGGGIRIDGKTYVPVNGLTNTLQAIITEDSNSVHIDKPNVHLFLFSLEKNAMKPFSRVYQGRNDFYVFVQVDNVKRKVHSIKTAVVDPKGQIVDSQVHLMTEENRDNMLWYTTEQFKIDFNLTGEYKVKFYLKQTEDHEFELLSEKAILSMKKD